MEKRWKHSHKSVFNVAYHFIWCPKYRRNILTGDIEKRLRELLRIKAGELEISIETMEIMPDHVHLFVKATPADAPHFIVGQLKGYTSRMLRREFPTISSRLPILWTRSYYCESVGSEDTIRKYIEEYKGK